MKRPPPDPAFIEFLRALIEKMLTAGIRSEEISATYLTMPKDVQREVERQNRETAKIAANLAAEKMRNAGYASSDWNSVPTDVVESIIRESVSEAQRQLREADDIEPEESRRSD